MDLTQLRVFRAAATAKGFTRASEQLHVSQSTVSQHIRQLEEELGCALFFRVGKRVVLSPAGEVLLEYSERILRDLQNAETAVREKNAIHRGIVRLGTGATTLTYRLAPVLRAYRQRFPDVELLIHTGTTETLLADLASQRVELAIVMLPIRQSELHMRHLGSEELVFAVHPSRLTGRRTTFSPADVEKLPFILYEKHTAMQNLIDRYFELLGISPRITMELENIEAIKTLVRADLGASLLPLCAVGGKSDQGLQVVRMKGAPLLRELGLVSLDSARMPVVVRELANMVHAGLRRSRSRDA